MTTDSGDKSASGAKAEAADVRARARAGIEQARRTASGVISATREKGEAVIDDTREKTYRAAAETNRLFQEHPIAAVAAAAAAGAVIGIFLPRIAVAGRAGKVAGQVVKAAVTSEAAQIVAGGLKSTRDNALRGAFGVAASVVGDKLLARRAAPDAADAGNDTKAAKKED